MTTPPDDDWQTKALANFSFEIVEARGEDALARWEELKTAGRAWVRFVLPPGDAVDLAALTALDGVLEATTSGDTVAAVVLYRRDTVESV